MENKIKLETLAQKSKKKKDFLIVAGIISVLVLVGFSVFNFSLSVDEKKKFIQKDFSKIKSNDLNLSTENGIKETWAISIENDLKNQDKKTDRIVQFLKEARKEDTSKMNDLIREMKKQQEDLVFKMEKELKKQENGFKIKIEESLAKQREELLKANPVSNVKGGSGSKEDPSENIDLGFDLLPTISVTKDNKKETSIVDMINGKNSEDSENPFGGSNLNLSKKEDVTVDDSPKGKDEPKVKKKKKISFKKIDTSESLNQLIADKRIELREIKARENRSNTYHIMTGLTKAFLITGVYAPVFSEGQSDPLPVLMQAQGDIRIANDDTQSLADCFFIGSAKGNMNSQTADIRLNKISCSLADGTKKIEGSISGWVIGENGIPGVQGELLHKNGAWMAKTFIAGFLETFSQSAVGFASAGGGGATGTQTVGSSLIESGSQSTSEVFSKMGEYYLKMAEQIFPVIEVKPGRSVDIMLQGGTSLTVTDFNSAQIDEIEIELEELIYQKELDQSRTVELSKQELKPSRKRKSMDDSSDNLESLPSSSKDDSFFED